jgi:hypothetical protein
MGKLRPQVRHPALPGTPRAKAGMALALRVRDAKAQEKTAKIRLGRRKPTARNQG